jgi:photosystem II stability/assembly factor-like uncharacterized protein
MQKIKISILLAVFAIVASGCSISFKSNDTSKVDGGFWVSLDKGLTWHQASSVPTVKGVGNITSFDGSSLAIDPSDSNAVYFGSAANGLYYTYNISSGWTQASSLKEAKINSVAVSKDDKCLIYATAGNKAYRSNDCSRTWTQIYFDNDVETKINYVAVDSYDAHRVYLGNSRGEIIKSIDRGDHWVTVLRAGSNINEIVISPQDSRRIFVTTVGDGKSWLQLKDKMTEFKNSLNVTSLIVSPVNSGLLFASTAYGLLRSPDNGDTWTKIELVTPEKEASINSLAVNPKDPKEIYYVTNTTFYSSSDGGVSWRTKKLPSTRSGWKLLIKPDEVNVIFMIMKKYQSSNSGQFGI